MNGTLAQRVKRLEDALEPCRRAGELLSCASSNKGFIEPHRQITLMALPKREGVPLRMERRPVDAPAAEK
jgi:hypothetical protein